MMKSMVKARLRAFVDNSTRKLKLTQMPEHIIFFRDGVSESQYQACIENEYHAVGAAWAELKDEITPSENAKIVDLSNK